MPASSISWSRVATRSRAGSPQFSAFGAVLIIGAAIGVIATILTLLSWFTGDPVDSPWGLVGAPAVTAAFAWFAYHDSISDPVGEAPESGGSARLDEGEPKLEPPHEPSGSARLDEGEPKLEPPHEPSGSPTVLRVENRLGTTFWLYTAFAAAATAVLAIFVVRFLSLGAHGRISTVAPSDLAGTALAFTATDAVLGMALALAAVPRRTLQARGRTCFWLSEDGIGYAPTNGMEPGFVAWSSVQGVSHMSKDARGIVYRHQWTIYSDGLRGCPVAQYPAGAIPRPRRIRQTIRELAPHVDV